jgi:hypothetical protein
VPITEADVNSYGRSNNLPGTAHLEWNAIARRAEKQRQEIESPLSGSHGGSFDLEKSRLLLADCAERIPREKLDHFFFVHLACLAGPFFVSCLHYSPIPIF